MRIQGCAVVVTLLSLFTPDVGMAEDWLILRCDPVRGEKVKWGVNMSDISVRHGPNGAVEFRTFNVERHLWENDYCNETAPGGSRYTCALTPGSIEWGMDQVLHGEPFRLVNFRVNRVDGGYTKTVHIYASASLGGEERGLCRRVEDPALQQPATAF